MRFIVLIALVFSFFSSVSAQNSIGFEFDYAKFNYDEDEFYLELYYSFDQNTLTRKSINDSSFISANLKLDVINSKNESVVNKEFNLSLHVDSSLTLYNVDDLIGVVGLPIPYGNYEMKISIKDNYSSEKSNNIVKQLDASKNENDSIYFSDIELCRKIVQEGANANSLYYKNGLEAIPNPPKLYDNNLPVLYYYVEIYNTFEVDKFQHYKLQRVVLNNNKEIGSKLEDIAINNNSLARAGFINISKYYTGRYTLVLNILDSENEIIASNSKLFYVHHPQLVDNSNLEKTLSGYISSEFGVFNDEECDYNFDICKYLATESEKDDYELLNDLEAKRKYLFDFWKIRDLTSDTPHNEFKEEYKNRVSYANSHYGRSNKKGYRTDRGRVLLIYGMPDRVDTKTNESNLKPYEIWSYNSIEGGVSFIFGDTMGFSQYELLHSTKRGELYNIDWERRLTIKGG